MTIIHIDHKASDEAVNKVREALEETALRDPNWNGADFKIERGDTTFIETPDKYAGIQLLNEVIYPALGIERG